MSFKVLELLASKVEPKSDGKITSSSTNRRVKAPAMPVEAWQPSVNTLNKDSIMDQVRRTCKGNGRTK